MDIHQRISLLKAEVEKLTAILEDEGLMTFGSQGQTVAHPALAQRHAAIALLHKLEASVDTDTSPSALDDFLGKAGGE